MYILSLGNCENMLNKWCIVLMVFYRDWIYPLTYYLWRQRLDLMQSAHKMKTLKLFGDSMVYTYGLPVCNKNKIVVRVK